MYPIYRWEITTDHIADDDIPEGTNCNAKGMEGPYGLDESITANRAQFKLYDDDLELYYTGYIYGEYEGFEPLDDFGTPNAGAVRIKLDGRWV